MTTGAALSLIALQLGWFSCVFGAVYGHPWIGPAVVVCSLTAHVLRRDAGEGTRETMVLAGSAVVGFVVDTALLRAGVISIPGRTVSPLWLVALWPNFAATTAKGASLAVLSRRPLLAAIVGALGGAIAYDGGARLGAISVDTNREYALVVIAASWGAALPGLFLLRRIVWRRPASR